MAEKIVLATHNAGKIREFKSILEPLGYEAVSVHDVMADITEPEETGKTFAENALLKATYYMKATGLPCLADDSGIAADALGGRPGVYSARYAGLDCDDEANNQKLIADLAAFPPEQWTVHYICSLVLIWPDGRIVTAEGSCDGVLRDFYAGDNGFGYDPLFYVPEKGKTMAEMTMEEKNAISHRGKEEARRGLVMSTVHVGLVSDSHGRFECLSRMADDAPDVAAWIHCGDYCDDGEDLAIYTGVPVYAVLGNNDYMTHTHDPECRCVTVGGVRIVAIHGCQWYGERRWQKLVELGCQNQADLVVFGHTHRRFAKMDGEMWVVNPGSIGLPRDGREGTYAIVSIDDGVITDVAFHQIER